MPTPELYEDGEEHWETKLHVGCGGIYLQDYINIDMQGIYVENATEAQMRHNATDIRAYYKSVETDSWDNLASDPVTIYDLKVDMTELHHPFDNYTVDKIVAIQCLEHLSPLNAVASLKRYLKLLRGPGYLICSVPDLTETLRWIEDGDRAQRDFAVRHLEGSKKNVWSYHRSWWTWETLREALHWIGFDVIERMRNFHVYPALVVKATKY